LYLKVFTAVSSRPDWLTYVILAHLSLLQAKVSFSESQNYQSSSSSQLRN